MSAKGAAVQCGMANHGCQQQASFAVWWKNLVGADARRFSCSRCLAATVADAIREAQNGEARAYLIGWTP